MKENSAAAGLTYRQKLYIMKRIENTIDTKSTIGGVMSDQLFLPILGELKRKVQEYEVNA